MYYGGWCNGFGGGWFMMIFWVFILIGGFFLLRHFMGGRGCRMEGGDSSLDTLKRRFAEGQITQEEYEKMRDVLRR